MSLELHALLMPDGDIQLEWATSEERISKSRQLLEKEIFRRFSDDKNVLVHKFLTKGTIEEKIDQMIESKTKLAKEIIQSGGEDWITKMDNNELIELFSLRGMPTTQTGSAGAGAISATARSSISRLTPARSVPLSRALTRGPILWSSLSRH